jgi:hypothetical protein
MASHSLPIPLPQAQARSQTHTSSRLPSVRIAIAIFAVLLILFGWLHLLVAMQTTSTNRLILIKAEELGLQKRDNVAVQRKIAEAESPRSLGSRLLLEGYQVSEPMYLPLPQLAAEDKTASSGQEASSSMNINRGKTSISLPRSLVEPVSGESSGTQTHVEP